MKKALTSVLVMFLTSPSLKAQNLVGNPGFEDTVQCPTGLSDPQSAVGWSIYRNSPDYFNTCADSATHVSVPTNAWGYQYPHTGNAYMGAQCYFTSEYREYFGRQLLSPLDSGQRYFVSFYINSAFGGLLGASGGCNKIGVLFSTIPYSVSSQAPIRNFAHVYTDSIITDTLNWIQIKGSFIADSSYDYIMFGNFFDDAHTDTIQYLGGIRAAYFFDDVCVSIDSNSCYMNGETINTINQEEEYSVFPNPASKQITIDGGKNIQSVELIDITGYLHIKLKYPDILFPIILDVSNLSRGIYILKINTLKSSLNKKIILN